MGRMEGKRAIVTGAASGIGAGISRRFVEEGCDVLLTDINEVAGTELARELGARFQRHDVTCEADWSAVIAGFLENGEAVDVVVNNAGIGNQEGRTTPENTTLQQWQEMVRINGEGVFLGCRFAIEAMKEKGGCIINMSSIAALVPSPQIAGYGFSKAGVAQYSRSVALHCAQAGYRIRCNSIHPGQIATSMHDRLIVQMALANDISVDEARHGLLSMIPFGEFGTPRDIANGVVYLSSDEGRYVTGIQLVIDGGIDLVT